MILCVNFYRIEKILFIFSIFAGFLNMDKKSVRLFNIYQHLPLKPNQVSTSDLQKKLHSEGVKISIRTLQLDLDDMLNFYEMFHIDHVGERPKKWFKDKENRDIEGQLTPSTALAFSMIKSNAKSLLPQSIYDDLNLFFEKSDRKLKNNLNNPINNWLTRVAVEPAGFQLGKPDICAESLKEVEQALIHKKQLELIYTKRPTTEKKAYTINPLGLIIRGSTLYLVATLAADNKQRLFACHRMKSAVLLPTSATVPADFCLRDYIDEGNISFLIEKNVQLVLRVESVLGHHFKEMPLSDDQKISDDNGHFFTITSTVNNSLELNWWLMSVADFTEVLAPKEVKETLITYLEKSISKYRI